MFEFLFRRRHAPEAPPAPQTPSEIPSAALGQAAPGTAIHYSVDLISKLKEDHQHLLSVFGNVKQASENADYSAVARHLDEFRVAIQGHLLMEKVRLYIYLEHRLGSDPERHKLIHDFRHEMDGIGKAVMGFLDKYRNIALDGNLAQSFGDELGGVGSVLLDRIRREEEILYPLYAR